MEVIKGKQTVVGGFKPSAEATAEAETRKKEAEAAMKFTDQERTFLNLVETVGYGFAEACDAAGLDKKEFSKHLLSKKGADLYNAAKVSLMRARFSGDSDMTSSPKSRKFYSADKSLILWESYCTKDKANVTMVMRAFLLTKNPHDTATMCGYTYEEYVEFVHENEGMLDTLKKYKVTATMI